MDLENDQAGTTADAIIIGAGPAGSTASRKLAEAGFSTLVLDSKMEIGAPVVCADLVNLGFGDLSELREDPRIMLGAPEKIEVKAGGESINFYPAGNAADAFNTIVERDRLDKELISRAVLAGAKLKIRAEFISATQKDAHVHVAYRSGGKTRTITSSHLILATGNFGWNPEAGTLSASTYRYQYRRLISGAQASGPTIEIGPGFSLSYMVPRGHAQANRLNVQKYADTTENSGSTTGSGKDIISGSCELRLGGEPTPGEGRILMAGMGAGFYDRFFMSGFREAFISGNLAALSIIGSRENGSDALKNYAMSVGENLSHGMEIQGMLKNAICRSSPDKVQELFSILSEYEYHEVSVDGVLGRSGLSIKEIEEILGPGN